MSKNLSIDEEVSEGIHIIEAPIGVVFKRKGR